MEFLGKENVPIYGWTKGVQLEEQALAQLHNVAKMPFIHHHIAVMPDVHWGMGATVGSVIPALGAIIRYYVAKRTTGRTPRGGCGLLAATHSLTLREGRSQSPVYAGYRARIPTSD